ncbi:MAG: thiamine pyrophosphate-binding protein, partial [SAR324 cluster bacterium]|nr:thiamine pyrophosphate-binding protein [SAR324 cluster bacterium]
DCIIGFALGLNTSKTGFNFSGFAPKAKKILVDIDEGQLHAQPVKPDIGIHADVRIFLQALLRKIKAEGLKFNPSPRWLEACASLKERYPIITEDYFRDTDHVNSYVFMDRLSDQALARDIVVAGNGIDAASYWQAFKVKRGQRCMINGNWGSMGWDLPAAVGACIGSNRRTICVTGDGSSQWNVQELLTIKHYNLPIKIFILNNQGYTNIRMTQSAFFGRFVGADKASGVSNPDFSYLASAYGLRYSSIQNNAELEKGIKGVLADDVATLCEVNISVEQGISPKASSFKRDDGVLESRPLEDMSPFLPRQEIWDNMHIFDED